VDLGYHTRPTFSIFCQVAVALELEHGALGEGAEDTVHLAGVEPQRAETGLELRDVLAPNHRPAEKEDPVAESIPRFI
jgi:hypothetical protein